MTSWHRVLVTAAVLCLAVAVWLRAAEVIERVMAEVAGRPVLLSDVRAIETLRGLDRSAALEALIDERLMLHEATRLPQVSLLQEEEERALETLIAQHPTAASVPRPALRRLARRQALILRYVELRFRPLVRVAEAELRAAYARRYAGTPAPPAYGDVVAEIEEALVAEELDRRVEAWVADLRASGEVRYVVGDEP